MKHINRFFLVMLCSLVMAGVLAGCTQDSLLSKVSAEELPETSKSCILIDYSTGQVLKEKEADKKLPIASMTKLMTTLLVLEAIDRGELSLDQNITVSSSAAGMGGSQIFLDANCEYNVGDLIKSIIISSANDSSVAFAEVLAGSEEEFVSKMNARAASLGMTNTQYANSTGLPAAGAYSTARDTAILTRELIKFPIYFNYSKIWTDMFKHPSGRETEMANTNRLVRFYKGCDFGKTGSTSEAGYCVSASAVRGDLRLISVVIGAQNSKSRFNEASKLFDHGFANYECKNLLEIEKPIDVNVAVQKSKTQSMPIVPTKSFSVLTKKGEKANVEIKYELPESVRAPVKKGEIVGKAYVTREGSVVEEVDLLAGEAAAGLSFWETVIDVVKNYKIKKNS